MPTFKRTKPIRHPHVRVRHTNPAVQGRTGKLSTGTITLEVGGRDEVIFHTLSAVAKKLGRTPARVSQLINSGELRANRWGRDLFVLDQDLREFVNRQSSAASRRWQMVESKLQER